MSDETELNDMLAFLADHLFADHALNQLGYSLAFRESLLTGNGMLEIVEAMRERSYRRSVYSNPEHGVLAIEFMTEWGSKIRIGKCVNADSEPEAVARAAYAALKKEV